jgi:hypothetical protein
VFILTHEDAFMLVNKAMDFDFRIHNYVRTPLAASSLLRK